MENLYPVFEINTDEGVTIFRTKDQDLFEAECKKYDLCAEYNWMAEGENECMLYAEVIFRMPTMEFGSYLENEGLVESSED